MIKQRLKVRHAVEKCRNRNYFFLFILSLFANPLFSQDPADSIHVYRNVIAGKVREIGPTEISYTLPGEEVVYRIYRRMVLRITFANGRKEIFNEEKNIEPIKSFDQWPNVIITDIAEETYGMSKIDFTSVKATGATVYSSVTGTQSRAFRKLKMGAAILGGNVVLLHNQSLEGNIYGQRTTRTQLTGTIYRSVPMDTTGLAKMLAKRKFVVTRKRILGANSRKARDFAIYSTSGIYVARSFGSRNFELDSGILYLHVDMAEKVNRFIVTHFSETSIVLAYQHKARFVEITLKKY